MAKMKQPTKVALRARIVELEQECRALERPRPMTLCERIKRWLSWS